MRQNVDLLKGNITKQFFKLLYPILICGIFQQLYTVINGILVGQHLGSDALAIIGGSSSGLINIYTSFAMGLVMGAIVIVSQLYGSRKTSELQKGIFSALFIAFVFGLFITLLYNFCGHSILIFLKVPKNILISSSNFLKLYSLSFIPAALVLMIINLLRAKGETKRPACFLIGSFLLNIFFDFLFIIILDFGLIGVSLSYIISQTVSALFLLIVINLDYSLFSKKLKIDFKSICSILKIGLPSGISSLFYAFTNLIMQAAVNKLGSDSIAAYAINGKIEMLFWIFMTGVGIVVVTFISQNFGADQKKRIPQIVCVSLCISFIISFLIILFLFFFKVPLIQIFTLNPSVVKIGTSIIAFLAPSYLTYVCIEVLSQALKGMGKILIPTYITLFGICFVRIAWILLVAIKHGTLLSIIYAYPISWIVTTLMTIIYYFIVKKKELLL